MALRIKREQVKRRMLKNLHIFVSPTRLCINNLPKSVTDKKLSKIFNTYAPKGATLTEVRVILKFVTVQPILIFYFVGLR